MDWDKQLDSWVSPDRLKRLAKNVEKKFDSAIGLEANEPPVEQKKLSFEESPSQSAIVRVKDKEKTDDSVIASDEVENVLDEESPSTEIARQGAHMEELRSQFSTPEGEASQIHSLNSQLEKKSSDTTNSDSLDQMKNRLAVEQQLSDRLQKELNAAMEGQTEELRQRMEDLSKDISEKNRLNVQLEGDKESLRQQLLDTQRQLEDLKAKNEQLVQKDAKRVEQLRRGLAKLESQGKAKEELEKEKEILTKQLNRERDLRKEAEENLKELEKKLEAQMGVDNQYQALQGVVEGIQSEAEVREEQLLQKLEDLQREKEEIGKQMKATNNERDSAVVLAEEWKGKLQKVEELKKELENKQKELLLSLSDERMRGDQLAQEVRSLQSEMELLKTQRESETRGGYSSSGPSDFQLEIQNKFERWRARVDGIDSKILLGFCLLTSLLFFWFLLRFF